ncbi:MAG: hypothetical protein GQ544_01205 [Candidatus Aminicenantes bacterium]|nr:hypothetical protein [Candidatus Aminicenantes bacterium]
MLITKSRRQLGLFSRMQPTQITIPQKASQKIQTLLADLMAGVWRSTTETLPKKSVSQGERSE